LGKKNDFLGKKNDSWGKKMTFWGKKNDYWGKKITFWGKKLFHSSSFFKNCTNGKLPVPGRLRPSKQRGEGRGGM